MTHDIGDGPSWEEDYTVKHDPKPIPLRSFDWEWNYKYCNGDEQNSGCCKTEKEAWEEAFAHHLEYKDM